MVPSQSFVELRADTRQALKSFLASHEGENFLAALNSTCPSIVKAGTAEDQLASAHAHRGYEECMERILFFVEPAPPEEKSSAPTNYPPLDDEKAWDSEKNGADPAQEG